MATNQLGGSTSGISNILSAGSSVNSTPTQSTAPAQSSAITSAPKTPSSVYWVGSNGNTYVKAAGVNGVQDYGKLPSGSNIAGSSLIADPNAPAPAAASSGSGASTGSADFNSSKNSALGSISDMINTGAGDFGGSIQDYIDGRATQQKSINSDAVNNELAREQGMQGILDMVGNGIKSGGVTLANSNAGSSSAAEALARAYGTTGRQQASSVGNQFAQGQNKIQNEQDALTAADATEARHVGQSKTDTINSIVNSARQQLSYLNQYAASASIPDRVDIENQIAQVKQQALDALSKYDGTLSQGTAAQAPQSGDQVRSSAQGLLTAGVAPASQFDYTTNIPTQLQGTGNFASSLPIFLSKKNNTQ